MKKNLFFLLIMTSIVSFTLCGCKKDKDPGNYMSIAGESYQLDQGVYFYNGQSNDLGYYVVCLTDEGMSYNGSSWSGEGNYLYLEFISSSLQGIASGTYTYGTTGELHFFSSNWGIDWSDSKADYTWKYITDGSIVVKDNGDSDYEFTLNCEDEDGDVVTAHFRGVLDFYISRSKNAASLINDTEAR